RLGRMHGRAPHHTRPGDVGFRPGSIDRAPWVSASGPRHPHSRSCSGRRHQDRVRERTTDTRETPARRSPAHLYQLIPIRRDESTPEDGYDTVRSSAADDQITATFVLGAFHSGTTILYSM